MIPGVKCCCLCKEVKAVSCFYRDSQKGDGFTYRCKACYSIGRRYDAKKNRRTQLEIKYGITEAEWETIFERQNGRCAICSEPLQRLHKKTHTDHDHKTNKVRGLLCPPCNLGLGQFKDDAGRLLAAASYLKESSCHAA